MANDWLQNAITGIDQEIEQYQSRIGELQEIRSKLSGDSALADRVSRPTVRAVESQSVRRGPRKPGRPPGRSVSAESRRKLSLSMKKRWAERKKKGANSLAG